MQYRAVFWDFGGVVTSSPFKAFNDYERANRLPVDFIRGVNATNPDANAWAQLERSELTPERFDALFAAESEALGHRVPGGEVLALLSGSLRPAMVRALQVLREHCIIACLTNNVHTGEGPGMQPDSEQARRVAEVMALFEFVQESSVIGIRKPDPTFYLRACETAGVVPEEVMYLDDLGINLKPARALGMYTIKVVDPAEALAELSEVLGIGLE